MKRNLLFIPFIFLCITLTAQDRYPLTQLTNEPAQQGFPSWSPDGDYLVFANTDRTDTLGNKGLWKLNLTDLKTEQIYSGIAEHPDISPGKDFIVYDAEAGKSVKMIPITGGEPIDLMPDYINIMMGGLPSWSPDGKKIVFIEGSTLSLWIRDNVQNEFRKIYQDENQIPLPGCWSIDGKSVYLAALSVNSHLSEMLKIDVGTGEVTSIEGALHNFYRYIDISPDGSLLAYVAVNRESRTSSIMVMPSAGGKSIEIVSPPGANESPAWSPDGTKIAFTSTRDGYFNIWMAEVDINALKKGLGIGD